MFTLYIYRHRLEGLVKNSSIASRTWGNS